MTPFETPAVVVVRRRRPSSVVVGVRFRPSSSSVRPSVLLTLVTLLSRNTLMYLSIQYRQHGTYNYLSMFTGLITDWAGLLR